MPIIISCPSCARQLRVPDDLLGKQVKCPACQTAFTAAADETPAPPPVLEAVQPIPGDAYEVPPPDPFARMSEPRGYERRDRFDDELRQHGGARSRVAGPALALMIVKSLTMLFLCLTLMGGLAAMGGGRGNDPFVGLLQVSYALLGVVFDLCIIYGAWQMKELDSHGWAMTACIMAVIPFGGCCLLSIPFGIWGLVVLNDPEVRQAFPR